MGRSGGASDNADALSSRMPDSRARHPTPRLALPPNDRAACNEGNDLADWLPWFPAWAWIAMAVGVLFVAVLVMRLRRPRESPVVALVRRRRELMSQLQQLAGEEAAELMRHESRRLRSGTNTIEVLEAALDRAERMTASGELGPHKKSKA
jgi:flagellar biosynthesis/type III secretory pathway M-ring protein FliF/YscJ